MTTRCECTEWYLTTSGWIRGNSQRVANSVYRQEPSTALAKYEYLEKPVDGADTCVGQTSMLWEKVERREKIDQLIALFGACPEEL